MPSLYSPMDEAIGHWRRYDQRGLTQVIARAGLEVVRVWSFNTAAVPGWWWNGRVRKLRSPPQDQVALYNRLVPVLRPLDRLTQAVLRDLAAGGRAPAEPPDLELRGSSSGPAQPGKSPGGIKRSAMDVG